MPKSLDLFASNWRCITSNGPLLNSANWRFLTSKWKFFCSAFLAIFHVHVKYWLLCRCACESERVLCEEAKCSNDHNTFSSSVGMSIEWLTGVSQVMGSHPDVFSCELNLCYLFTNFHDSRQKFRLAKKIKILLCTIKTLVASAIQRKWPEK